jgi:uroporphyrinogen decarboxylase
MTQRERFLSAALGGRPDSVPVAPYMGNFGAAIAGVPIGEYNTDGARMARAQIRAWELLGQDVVVAQSDGYYIAEGFGCVIEQPRDSTPHLIRPAAATLEEACRLTVPDPRSDGRMPVYIEAVRLLKEHFGDRVAIRGTGTGPFSLASYLTGGTENFLMEIATAEMEDDAERQRQLKLVMEISSDALIAFLKATIEAGSDIAQAGDSLASLSMISPAIYEKYVFPYEVKVFQTINPLIHERGGVTLLHICGDTTRILPLMSATGADILEVDSLVDIGGARRSYGDRVAFMGNIEPSRVLFQGTPELVYRECSQCLASAKAAEGGFILGSGCEVPPNAPLENLRAMVKAARDFGGGGA